MGLFDFLCRKKPPTPVRVTGLKVILINETTILQTAEIVSALPAFQTQVTEHFAPAWGRDAQIVVGAPEKGAWNIHIVDSCDAPGALGYHDMGSDGLPYAQVGALTARVDGVSWTSVVSHELLEMLADPFVNSVIFLPGPSDLKASLVYLEVCDAPERLSYKIGGVEVSDFVYPAWFIPQASGPYDYLKQVGAPLKLLSGGYISEYEILAGSGWQNKFGRKIFGPEED